MKNHHHLPVATASVHPRSYTHLILTTAPGGTETLTVPILKVGRQRQRVKRLPCGTQLAGWSS